MQIDHGIQYLANPIQCMFSFYCALFGNYLVEIFTLNKIHNQVLPLPGDIKMVIYAWQVGMGQICKNGGFTKKLPLGIFRNIKVFFNRTWSAKGYIPSPYTAPKPPCPSRDATRYRLASTVPADSVILFSPWFQYSNIPVNNLVEIQEKS